MRKILSCILAAAMLLSLLVVAGAAETETPGKVILRPSAKVNGDGTVTYTFTLDATGSDGVGALSFTAETTNLTFKNVVYNGGGKKLDEVFKSATTSGEGTDGIYGFTSQSGCFMACGGDYTSGRVLTGEVVLVALTYTITDPAAEYGLKVTEFKACYSGVLASSGQNYTCQVAEVTIEPTTGVTVSGTAISWNNSDDAEYLLYPGDTTDDTIKTEWKNGAYPTALSNTADKGAVAANADGKRYDQSFTFGNVAAGEYKLAILKPGKYVPKIVAVTVGTADLALGEQKLWLYGDVTYDGKVDASDVLQMNRYVVHKSSMFAMGDLQEQADRVSAGNITAIMGVDTMIDASDILQINRYIVHKTSMFNAIN